MPVPAAHRSSPETPALPAGTILFEDVYKTYHIMERATPRLGAWVLNKLFEHLRRSPFNALEGVSFRVQPGEMIGLIGPNGAGKSTLLKLISGITQPTSGRVAVSGRIASMLELGVGFHPELSGMENIFYSGIVMGMSRQEILEVLDEIIAFSGLRDFLFEPVKHYSSGMYARLACSVALHLRPEIILLDEILAVGDSEFQQRGSMKVLEASQRGVTVLIVTHEPAQARDLCDRIIWIEDGKLRMEGNPQQVYESYMREKTARSIPPGHFAAPSEIAHHSPDPEYQLDSAMMTVNGKEATRLATGEEARLWFRGRGKPGRPVRLGLLWRWSNGKPLSEEISPPFQTGEDGSFEVAYDIPRMPLLETEVTLAAGILDAETGAILSSKHELLKISITTPGPTLPEVLVRPRAVWKYEKLDG